MKIRFDCAVCGKTLGFYEGEQYWLSPFLPNKEMYILCKKCKDKQKRETES